MTPSYPTGTGIAAAVLVAAGTALVLTPPSSAEATDPTGIPGCSQTQLLGVSVDSASDGWAVGYTFNGQSLVSIALHWSNGRWRQVPTPVVGRESYLYAVSALNPSNAFAVGEYSVGRAFHTLVLEWTGRRWQRVDSPNPDARDNELYGVTMLGADDAWAVGAFGDPRSRTLAMHWDGASWTRIATPNPSRFDYLQAVDGTARDDVWAVGGSDPGTLAMHWNGTSWRRVASQGRGSLDVLFGVSAVSRHDVWGVGSEGLSPRTLAERWDGAEWRIFDTPDPGALDNTLSAVDAVGSGDAWAVGAAHDRHLRTALAAHWDGTSWQQVPVDGRRMGLAGVSMVAPDDVWAVGWSDSGSQCLIERWNGSDWSRWTQ